MQRNTAKRTPSKAATKTAGFAFPVRRDRGITITEVVIATALLTVAMVPMLKALTASQVNTRLIEQQSKSIIFAQSKFEQLRAKSIHNFGDSLDENSTNLGGDYLCNVNDDENSTLKKVSVSVGYDNNGNGLLNNQEVNITLHSYIARRD